MGCMLKKMIFQSLNELFIRSKNFIRSIIDFFKFLYFFNTRYDKNKKTLLVFSHDGSSSGGAPVVLFKLLENLELQNYNVVILFKNGGELVTECKKKGYAAYIYQYISTLYIKIIGPTTDSSIVNTVVCGNVIEYLQEVNSHMRIVWWIHEGKDVFEMMTSKLPRHLSGNTKVACVSQRSKDIFKEYYPKIDPIILHYGLKDYFNEKKFFTSEQKVFSISIIGMLSDRKNQLQIIDALKLLPKNILENLNINVVAATWNEKYKKNFMNEAAKYNQIKLIPGLSHEKLLALYGNTDLLICCSKDDPLPVVVSEAMMMECPCLVSSGCGQYEYIENGINGYKYDVNNTYEMASKIVEIFNNKDIEKIKLNERKIYLREFSMQQSVNRMSHYLLL